MENYVRTIHLRKASVIPLKINKTRIIFVMPRLQGIFRAGSKYEIFV